MASRRTTRALLPASRLQHRAVFEHHLLLLDNLRVTGDGVEEFLRVLQQDGEYSNMEIGSIELTRPPIEHTERRPGGYHHHDHKASKRLVTMIDALDELLERNRRVK